MNTTASDGLRIGWAQVDITPPGPVLIAGQFHARVSEGVLDPITATVLVLEGGGDQAVFVSCDLVSISHELRDAVRSRVAALTPGAAGAARAAGHGAKAIDPRKVVLNATHTHAGPEMREPVLNGAGRTAGWPGVDLPVMALQECIEGAAEKIAAAVVQAWQARAPGQIAFGQGYAVVSRNRRWVDQAGKATMYGNTNTAGFDHIEGYEDHAIQVMTTRDLQGALTGLIVNLACPSQETEQLFSLSADYWCEARAELRKRVGAAVPILAQCSAAGELTPHLIYDKLAAERMLRLKGRTARQEIAVRIADCVAETLGWLKDQPASVLPFCHEVLDLNLPLATLTAEDAAWAEGEAAKYRVEYEREQARIAAHPAVRTEPRWYVGLTYNYRRMTWYRGVVERYQRGAGVTQPAEVHVIRLGEIIFATNPFELYLDFGTTIKARSPAVQTLLVQLAGPGTYVPSARSVAGGGYGSVPASNPVGPEGGRMLAEKTLETIAAVWQRVPVAAGAAAGAAV